MSIDQPVAQNVHSYAIDRPKFDAFSQDVRRILTEILREEGITFHSIEARAKAVDSFQKKISRTNEDGTLRYREPLKEVTDLAAVRVIVFTPKMVPLVCETIEKTFRVKEKKDIGEERSDTKDFGYQSMHYLVLHTDERLKLKEFRKFKDMICEIQVRTILQHAWAEIEHDIQYKSESEIPKEIGRKFRALAGLIEIADREFQSIQDMDFELRDAIQKSVVNELTKAALNRLESQSAEGRAADNEQAAVVDRGVADQIAGTREYLLKGEYEKALEVYNRNVAINPNGHTQYLGRAKVRFLLGDRSGALADIEEANKRAPDDPASEIIKEQIERGTISLANIKRRLLTSSSNPANEAIRLANEALSKGFGEEAFVRFSEAESLDYNQAFTAFGKAMACALVGDAKGAASFLGSLRQIPGTPMEINIVALKSIISEIEKKDNRELLYELKELLKSKSEFDLTLSPLKHLKAGFDIRSTERSIGEKAFKLLGDRAKN